MAARLGRIGRSGATAALAATLMGLPGCGSSSRTAKEPAAVTFSKDIAPILFDQCAPCHRPGEAAPFSVLGYEEVRQRASRIVDVTRRRYMPPWLPSPGYGDFTGQRRLTDAQIATLRQWQQQGAQEGEAADLPPVPHFTEGWQLGEPDLVITLPTPYSVPAGTTDIWRNFVMPIRVPTSRYVKTVELRPGTAKVVHHALMAVDPTKASRRRDERDAEPGFEGMDMGDAQAPDGHILGWTPGMLPVPGDEGRGWLLKPGTDLVLQLHLMPSRQPQTVQPSVGFYFDSKSPAGPPMILIRLDADQALDIPAGEKDFVVTDAFKLPVDVDVLAVYPHAHFLARKMEGLAKLPDGTERPLIRIDDWDFKWQDVYRYAKPVSLTKGTTISMRYSYDNSAGNLRNPAHPPRRVTAGLRSSDEMAHLQLQVAARTDQDVALLKEALSRHQIEKNPGDAWAHYDLANVLRDNGDIDGAIARYREALRLAPDHGAAHNNLGVLLADHGQLEQAIDQYLLALRVEPDSADANFNLGNALSARGRTSDAIDLYQKALRLEPNMTEAHVNLGRAFAVQGKLDEAVAQFREAVRLDAGSAEAHNNLGAALGSLGRLDDAIGEFRRALQIEPNNARARDNLRVALEKVGPRAK